MIYASLGSTCSSTHACCENCQIVSDNRGSCVTSMSHGALFSSVPHLAIGLRRRRTVFLFREWSTHVTCSCGGGSAVCPVDSFAGNGAPCTSASRVRFAHLGSLPCL